MKLFLLVAFYGFVVTIPALAQDEGKIDVKDQSFSSNSIVLAVGGGSIDIGAGEGHPSFFSAEVGYNWRMSPFVSLGASFWLLSIESDPGSGGTVTLKFNGVPVREKTKFSPYAIGNVSFGKAMLTTEFYKQEYAKVRMIEFGPGIEYRTGGRLGIFAQGTYSLGGTFFGHSLHFLRATIGTHLRL
jgi:hypothetical protein